MTLQKETYITQSLGRQGLESRQDPISQGSPFFAETFNNSPVVAGGFVFKGTKSNQVRGIGSAGEEPLGIAVFNGVQTNIQGTENCNINHGENVRVVFKGCVFAKGFTNGANAGEKVFVDPTTGDLEAGTSGAGVDTGWTVKTGAVQGQVVEIEKL